MIEDSIEILAKWAVKQDAGTGGHENGVQVAYMFSLAARVKQDGTREQKNAIRQLMNDWNKEKGPADFGELNQRILALMGWER